MVELSTQLLEIVFGVRSQGCVISKQHCSDEYCTHLGLCPQVAELNNLPLLLMCKYTHSSKTLNGKLNNMEKKMPNKVGSKTHSCFTPL